MLLCHPTALSRCDIMHPMFWGDTFILLVTLLQAVLLTTPWYTTRWLSPPRTSLWTPVVTRSPLTVLLFHRLLGGIHLDPGRHRPIVVLTVVWLMAHLCPLSRLMMQLSPPLFLFVLQTRLVVHISAPAIVLTAVSRLVATPSPT